MMGIESIFLSIAFASYFLAAIAYVIFLVTKWEPAGKTGSLIAFAGLICHTIALVSRIIIAKRLVGYNFYEYMSVFAWGTVLVYLIAERKTKLRIIGVFVLPVVILLLGYASVLPKNITPLVPALRSYWLQIHIITTVVSYSSFTLSFGAGIIYLIRKKLPFKAETGALEIVISRAIIFGFPFLTIGILSGAIWAQYIWNRAWSWDPKETSSLVTWLVYAAYLHTRLARGWSGKRAAILSIIGFACVIFTYLGVDLLVPRAHTFLFNK
ncbi:MAG: cytochrome c biogenesis protein CcsA [Spirochaetes bacterium]|nr:cytochrome c biogenesis protein CcsA [Spirochaetota bacterium]